MIKGYRQGQPTLSRIPETTIKIKIENQEQDFFHLMLVQLTPPSAQMKLAIIIPLSSPMRYNLLPTELEVSSK